MQKERSDIDFEVGAAYPFTVRNIFNDYCELLDESGFRVYLKHTRGLNLVKGQSVKCKVVAYTKRRPLLELIDIDEYKASRSDVGTDDIEEIMAAKAEGWQTDEFARLILMSEVEDQSFENECRRWITGLNGRGVSLSQVHDDCIWFMEESEFLSRCNARERDNYQQRLTLLIDMLGYYSTAGDMLVEGRAVEFVDSLYDKLAKSAYVYHPYRAFNLLSCLFLLNPELMDRSMGRLFDVLRKWPLDIWTQEPFRSTLVKMLELYVDENIWHVDRVRDNASLVNSLIQALSILTLLADRDDSGRLGAADRRLTLSRLCSLSTYTDSYHQREALDMAVSCLAAANAHVPTFGLADTAGQQVCFKLKNTVPAHIDTPNTYINGRLRMVVSDEGIAIYGGKGANLKAALPDKLNLWQNLQVYTDRQGLRSLAGNITIKDCKNLWEDINSNLFTAYQAVARPVQQKRHLRVNDEVRLRVVRKSADDNDKFYCRIEGEDGESGYITVQDIVSYNVNADLSAFRNAYGQPYVFDAVIIDKDDEGLHFSMLEPIKEWISKYGFYGEDELVVCSLGVDHPTTLPPKQRVPAITPDGLSISLGGFDNLPAVPLRRGDIVLARQTGMSTGTFILDCEAVSIGDDTARVYASEAFTKLMGFYRRDEYDTDGNDSDDSDDTDFEQQSDIILDATYVKELIRAIDRMAYIDADYVRSYNYLAFARALCKMIGWDPQATYYNGRMDLIVMLYDFAINDHVDRERLSELQTANAQLFSSNALLFDKFRQLQVVSFMGSEGHDSELWGYCSGGGDNMLKEIASLALAYNIMVANNMTSQANDILNRVKLTLKLRGYESNLKIYGPGVESQTVEYKSSVVFPPDNSMRPNMRRQMHNILTVIAAFLNTDGGVLYIGTNDSGAGIGLDNDLNYPEFSGDKDKYQRTVLDAVCLEWSNAVAPYVTAHWDSDENGKDVLIVEVKPYLKGVALDGVWYVKQGSTKRGQTKEDFDSFNAGRIRAAALSQNSADLQGLEETSDEDGRAGETAAAAEKSPDNDAPADNGSSTWDDDRQSLPTSRNRSNVLDDYLDDYRPYEACLNLLEDGKFSMVSRYDYSPSLLTLKVYDEDTDGYLVLAYADGSVTKVRIDELLRCDEHKEYTRSTASPLVFASLAHPTDALVTVSKENKRAGREMVRVDSLQRIDEGRLNDKGERFFNEGLADSIVSYEIVPGTEALEAEGLLDRDQRTLGFPIATVTPDIKEWLAKWHVGE